MCMAACVFTTAFSQDEQKEKNDTIRIGGMIIVKKTRQQKPGDYYPQRHLTQSKQEKEK